MAKKASNRKTSPAAATQRPPVNELAVLHPDATVRIAGRVLQVREYRHIEGLQLQVGIKPLLDSLHGVFSAAEAPPAASQLREVLAIHATSLQWLMAQAITPLPALTDENAPQRFMAAIADNAAWVGSLDEVQGDALMAVWWGVNVGFFTRRLRERLLADRAGQASTQAASTPT